MRRMGSVGFVGMIALAAMTVIGVVGLGCTQDWERADSDAKEFVSHLPGATGDVSCAHKDSDGDGYCSCSAFMKDGTVTPLDCGCQRYCLNCATGCKLQLPFKRMGGGKP